MRNACQVGNAVQQPANPDLLHKLPFTLVCLTDTQQTDGNSRPNRIMEGEFSIGDTTKSKSTPTYTQEAAVFIVFLCYSEFAESMLPFLPTTSLPNPSLFFSSSYCESLPVSLVLYLFTVKTSK